MVDFKKRLGVKTIQKPTDPYALYETLDRASDKGPLRPAQEAILEDWHVHRRNEKDIILKLHTGQGKTLIGLLILQSKLNESSEPAIYLCPNNYLIEQTCHQAKQFGIRYCTVTDRELPEEFVNGQSILITSVQKMFNGRTKFQLGNQSIPVSYVLMDDAHACIDAIRDAFCVRISHETPYYQRILQLFAQSLTDQGAGTFEDIKIGNPDSVLPIPYWDWQDKHAEVIKILSDAVKAENEKQKNRADIWFAWPLIKDIVQHCQCIVAGHSIEISPHLPPLDMFGSFYRAKHRIFMSATVTNDAFLIKGLRLCSHFGNDGNPQSVTIMLPKDLDEGHRPETRKLTFKELVDAMNELNALIEEFDKLAGFKPETDTSQS